jgi:hypothetical protein
VRAFLDTLGKSEGEVLDRLRALHGVRPGGGRPDAVVVVLTPSPPPPPGRRVGATPGRAHAQCPHRPQGVIPVGVNAGEQRRQLRGVNRLESFAQRCQAALRVGCTVCVVAAMHQRPDTASDPVDKPRLRSCQRCEGRLVLRSSMGGCLAEAPTPLPPRLGPFHAVRIVRCFSPRVELPAVGSPRLFEGPPARRDRLARIGRPSGLRIDRGERLGAAWRVIGTRGGDMAPTVVSLLQPRPGIRTMLRARFLGHQEAIRRSLPHQHTVGRTPRRVAIQRTRRRRGAGTPVRTRLSWAGPMTTHGLQPSLDRRLGQRHTQERGHAQRPMPETYAAHHSQLAGDAAHAVAHRRRCRYALDGRWTVPALGLVIPIVSLGSDEPGRPRIVERRTCMHVDVGDFLAPITRRGRPSRWLKIAWSQIECDQRRSVFDGRADTCGRIHLRDSRLTRHLHRTRHPIPFATTDVPVAT